MIALEAADRSAQGKLHIRRAVPADLPLIAAIEGVSFSAPWPEDHLGAYFGDRASIVLVAEEGLIVGFLIARDEPTADGRRMLHIHDLAVAPSRRRQAVGSSLLAKLIGIARSQGIPRLRLEVRVENEGARLFYEHHGFQVVRRVARYYEDGGAALRMERHIAADR